MTKDSIAAIATPPGIGGVGIVRISGNGCQRVADQILGGRLPPPRYAALARFRAADAQVIEQGIALYFQAPHSFTGEDVLELHGHGGPVVMDLLLQRVLECGVRLARAGEFSERAFLNGKIDLAQAEAIADLIESGSAEAARLASRTLQGAFSQRIHQLVGDLTELRTYVEAALDFSEEEIDLLSDQKVGAHLRHLIDQTAKVHQSARSGRLLRDGLYLVIAGRPNAGKSSLLNALTGREAAIVTEIPGTTRDLLRERILIDGIPLHLADTAGLREDAEAIEAEGIRRARAEIEQADHILWVFDDQADPQHLAFDRSDLPPGIPCTLVRNKVDRTGRPAGKFDTPDGVEIAVSAKHGEGIDELKAHLKRSAGYQGPQEGEFIARRRHIDAIERASKHLLAGETTLHSGLPPELLAEDLRQAQKALGEITGELTSDDLLGEIFSSFCIGK